MSLNYRNFTLSKYFPILEKIRKRNSLKRIPGPKEIPVLGHLHLFSKFGPYKFDKMNDAFMDLRLQYGPIVRLKLGVEMVVLFDPKDACTVLRNESKQPNRPVFDALVHYRRSKPQLYKRMGLFTDNGPDWYYMRLLSNPLLKREVSECYHNKLNEVGNDFLKYIESRMKRTENGIELNDVLPHLYKYTQEAAGVVCFGDRLGMFSPERSELADSVNEAVGDSLECLGKTLLGVPWWKLSLHTPIYKKLCKSQEVLRDVTEKFLDRAITISPEERGPFLDHLLAQKDLDRRDTITLLLELFHAGIDATASIIAFGMYHIARHPEIQRRIIEEVDSLHPSHSQCTTASLDKVEYLRACMKETMRLSPTAGGTARVLPYDFTLSNYSVSAGTLVLCSHPVMSRDETLVKDPEAYKPERYYGVTGVNKDVPPFVSLPFAFGLRMCPGRRLAQQEFIIFLTKFFQRYRLEYPEGRPEVGSEMRLNMLPDQSINLKVFER